MTWTANDLAALEKAIASGAREVAFRDRKVSYRSQNEMLSALRRIKAALYGGRPRRRYAAYQSGIHNHPPGVLPVAGPATGIGGGDVDGGTFGDGTGGGDVDGGQFGS